MQSMVNGIPVHYVEHGSGMPVIALHGAYSAHQEVLGFLEPFFSTRPGYRRIYVDLPSMGKTPAPETIKGSDDVLKVVLGLIDNLIGNESFLIVAHSYGGYIARGIANRRPEQVAGMALICPVVKMGVYAGEHQVIQASGDLTGILTPEQEPEFRNYFVVQTPETIRRFQESVAPVLGLTDSIAIERLTNNWELHPSPDTGADYTKPSLILTGRYDAVVGCVDQWALLEHYTRATYAALENAGHALPHEQPELFQFFMGEWLDRVQQSIS